MDYNAVEKAAKAFGSALLNLPGAVDVLEFPEEQYEPARKMRLLGLFSVNRIEWLISEQGGNDFCPQI